MISTGRDTGGVKISGVLWPALGGSAVFLAGVTLWFGWSYYSLPLSERPWAQLHDTLAAGGTVGHTLGIAGSLLMVANLLYLVRRRWARVRFLGSVSAWLAFHVAAGIGGVSFVLVHSAGKWENPIARASTIAAVVVLCTGVLGRWIYGQVAHSGDGEEVAEGALVGQMRAILASVGPEHRALAEDAERSLAAVLPRPIDGALGAVLFLPLTPLHALRLLAAQVSLRLRLGSSHPRPTARAVYGAAVEAVACRKSARRQHAFKRLVGTWRGVHRIATFVLLLTLIAHVVIILFVGGG